MSKINKVLHMTR